MNLFFARLFGKLQSTEKYESSIYALVADAKRYHELLESDIYKEYLELEKETKDERFLARKKEYLTKKYKETVEYKNHTEFIKLQKDKTVKKFIRAISEEERQKYEGAIVVKNYLQLKEIVEAPGFETNRLFWADKKRWYNTEDHKKELRLEDMKKNNADIKFLLNAPVEKYREMEKWTETFHITFHESCLTKNQLQSGFWFKNPNMKRDFSIAGQAQAYVGDRNVNIQEDVLSILMKRETVDAPVWDGKQGFVLKSFDYTSSNINTADSFTQSEGRFTAKVRATGSAQSAIYLVGEDGNKLIELAHYNGKNFCVGTVDKTGHSEEVLKSLPASQWQIFEVSVTKTELVWTLNNMVVFRTNNPFGEQKLYFAARVFASAKKGAEGRLDIDWIRASKQ